MRRMVWLALAGAVVLGGCNLVTSEQPLFHQADTRATPALKPGLWAVSDPNCQFDSAQPMSQWPKCAQAEEIPSRQGVLHMKDGTEVLIAAGDPLIAQIYPIAKGAPIGVYFYGAIRPLARDVQERVIEFETWPALCGPPPPPNDTEGDGRMRFVTRQPLPGLTIDGENCAAKNPAAVRRAAVASRAWVKDFGRVHWVRDADP
jgi:hypothetical protein